MSLADFRTNNLQNERAPTRLSDVAIPSRGPSHPSPVDWRQEVIYFLLPDRFSDGQEQTRTALNNNNVPFPAGGGSPVPWDQWARSGGERWQGGTLNGLRSKLGYLRDLGVTTVWIGPVFKQRGLLNTYHAYGIQDFLEVDPHFGTRADLVRLVSDAHGQNMRVILDVVFNHSGWNWNYEGNQFDPPYRPWPGFYERVEWLDEHGVRAVNPLQQNDGVWPTELQVAEAYTRAGKGSLSGEDLHNIHAEFRRTDFDGSMRDFNFDREATLKDLAACYKYWIALTDCDGFRLDTLKHVDTDVARNFCGTIKEFASNLGKTNFFLVGEVGGADLNAETYRKVLKSNMNATLDIGETRLALTAVAKGLQPASDYFGMVAGWDPNLGSTRDAGLHHVVVLDDHDHVFHVPGWRVRFSTDAATLHQVVAGVAIQLFSLGIPCIYYGTEQSFAGPPRPERERYLPDYGFADKFLRETMFGATHSSQSGAPGAPANSRLPGFTAFGAYERHCFRTNFPTFIRIRALINTRQTYPVLQFGRQYLREIRTGGGGSFANSASGEIFAWSRILDQVEALCVVNGHGNRASSADVIVDGGLNASAGATLQVVCNSAEAAEAPSPPHRVGSLLNVQHRGGRAHVEIRDLPPSEVLVLINRP